MWKPNTWTIERGGDFQMLVHLIDPANDSPINISGASQVNLLLKKSDGSTLTKAAYTGIACGLFNTLWIYGFLLTATDTASLPLMTGCAIELQVLWGTQTQHFAIQSNLSTVDPII